MKISWKPFAWVAALIGQLYYLWFCIKLQIFGWFIAGFLIPPMAILIGLWSLFFGVPDFMLPEGFNFKKE